MNETKRPAGGADAATILQSEELAWRLAPDNRMRSLQPTVLGAPGGAGVRTDSGPLGPLAEAATLRPGFRSYPIAPTAKDLGRMALPALLDHQEALVIYPTVERPGALIGEGGQALIYSFIQRDLSRQVAVKTLRVENRSVAAIENLIREACVTARLEHPNIVPVYSLHLPEHADDAAYWVMKRIRGRPLTAHLPGQSEPWVFSRLLEAFYRILEAVAFAHSRGIVHRDLKPDNVLVGEFGEVQVTDWGLAVAISEEWAEGVQPIVVPAFGPVAGEAGRAAPGSAPLAPELVELNARVREGSIGAPARALAGGWAGTPVFMAAEQLELTADHVDERTDVFQLGGILYSILTGEPPHHLGTDALEETIKAITDCSAIPTPLDRRRELGRTEPQGLSEAALPSLSAIVMKALARDPAERYATALELSQALKHWEDTSASEELSARAEALLASARSARSKPAHVYAEAIALANAALDKAATNERALRVRKEATAALTAFQRRARRNLIAAASAIGLVFVVGAVGYYRTNVQRMRADEQTARAKVARTKAEEAQASAETSEKKAQRQAYFAQIPLVQKMIEDGNVRDAEDILEDCPKVLRRWEWGWLEHVCHLDRRTFQGPALPIIALAFSPDGRRVSAAYSDGAAHFWDRDSGRELLRLPPNAEGVRAIAFSPDGIHLAAASGGQASSVVTWDFDRGAVAAKLQIAGDQILALDYSRDGRQIACGGDHRVIYLCEAETGRTLHTLTGHTSVIQALGYAPDGRQLASASHDATVRLWDTATGECERVFQGDHAFQSVAFDALGRKLAAGDSQGRVWVWDTVSGGEPIKLRGQLDRISSAAFTPDGAGVAAGCYGKVKVWELTGGNEALTFNGHKGPVLALAYSPDGKLLISGGQDGAVKLWDSAGRPATTLLWQGDPERLWYGPYNVAFSPSGKYLAAGINDMTLVFDVAQKREVASLKGYRGSIASVTFDPDGKYVAGAVSDRTVKVWDRESGQILFDFKGYASLVSCVGFSPDGRTLSTMATDGAIKGWDLQSGSERFHVEATGQLISAAAFSPDGKRVFACGRDGSLRVWDTDKGDEVMHLPRRADGMYAVCVAISPDGRLMVAGCDDHAVRVWDLRTGRCLIALGGHSSPVNAIAISSDSARIASTDLSGTMRIWEIETGHQLLLLNEGLKTVSSVAYSPDGTCLATGSYDQTLRLWETTAPEVGEPSAPR